jgi:hypothetical protein
VLGFPAKVPRPLLGLLLAHIVEIWKLKQSKSDRVEFEM